MDGATTLVVHLDAADDAQLAAWPAHGFEPAGSRIKWSLALTPGHRVPVHAVDGIEIVELADRPELVPAAHEAWKVAYRAIPDDLVSGAAPSFEEWWGEVTLPDGTLPPGFHVAIDPDDRVVGITLLWTDAVRADAGVRFTGVVTDWLGQGVARQLKEVQINWAAANGITSIRCSNNERNHAMLHLNEALGYTAISRVEMLKRSLS